MVFKKLPAKATQRNSQTTAKEGKERGGEITVKMYTPFKAKNQELETNATEIT